jgi:hypothetical protein
MQSRVELVRQTFDYHFSVLHKNLSGLTLDEALFTPEGCFRSILGTLKHTAAWAHVYRSYAFDAEPRGWYETDWPRGLRDTVDLSEEYLDEVLEWLYRSYGDWINALNSISDIDLDELRPVHWGADMPLQVIVLIIGGDYVYHAGEINQLLAIARQEAWEEGEEVEENHISTVGHRVRPPWMDQGTDSMG